MMRLPALGGFLVALIACFAFSQEAPATGPAYRGPITRVEGIFVAPVPNVPFSAIVTIESRQLLSDGSTEATSTRHQIARDTAGRIRNELRELMPGGFTGTPTLISTHLYDPETRLSTFLNPATRIARQMLLRSPMQIPPPFPVAAKNAAVKDEDLGTQVLENVTVHGLRRTRTIPANLSGTGTPVEVTDEYWYSEDMRLNMLIVHEDPRSGKQTITVTQMDRSEPAAELFQIPSEYKVVDETPNR
jgi:hypothetical protein